MIITIISILLPLQAIVASKEVLYINYNYCWGNKCSLKIALGDMDLLIQADHEEWRSKEGQSTNFYFIYHLLCVKYS